MPELPEVETVVTELKASLVGTVIDRAELFSSKIRYLIPGEIIEICEGQKIIDVVRRAKYILVELDNDYTIVIHLGMTGKISISNSYEYKKHDHIVLELSNSMYFSFNDARKFGLLDYCKDFTKTKYYKNIGPEPLSESFTGDYLHKKIVSRKSPIKNLIMDQPIVVGVGNIYASEALFRSKISPLTLANKVSKKACNSLVLEIKKVLQEAIESGGSTLRDYVRSSGDLGYFQHKHFVYGREGKECRICNNSITRVVQAGRSSFFCSKCQK